MARKIRDEEKEKYRVYGLVKLAIQPGERFIEFFQATAQPIRAWLNRHPGRIELLIADKRIKDYSARSVQIEGNKILEGFEIDWSGRSNKEMLHPVYKSNRC